MRMKTPANQRTLTILCSTKICIALGLCATLSLYWFYIIPSYHESIKRNELISPVELSLSLQQDSSLNSFSSKLKTDNAYEFALLKLRCFATPGCFPSVKCIHGSPQKIARSRGKQFEEQSFCAQDLRQGTTTSQTSEHDNQKCLVYSFGLYNNWEWEAKIAAIFGCEVHAFDPTVQLSSNLAPGVTFHELGLQGTGTDMSVTHSNTYKAIEQHRLLSLEGVRGKLGHQNRTIDVLMLDCEGCEWGVLRQMCDGTETRMINQIMTEFHFQKNLGLHDENQVMIAAEAVSCLEKDRWAVTSMELEGSGFSDMEYVKGVSSVVSAKGFLMLVSLRRIPEHQKLPHELIEDEANAARKEELKMFEYIKKYGRNRTQWPSDFAELNGRRKEESRKVRRVFQNRRNFDSNGYVEEKANLLKDVNIALN